MDLMILGRTNEDMIQTANLECCYRDHREVVPAFGDSGVGLVANGNATNCLHNYRFLTDTEK